MASVLFVLVQFVGVGSLSPVGTQEPTVRLTPEGDCRVLYHSTGKPKEFLYSTATKIDPQITSRVTALSDGRYKYDYEVANGPAARQELGSLMFQATNVEGIALDTPDSWEGMLTRSSARVSWFVKQTQSTPAGLKRGEKVAGFGMTSDLLPGPTEVHCRAAAGGQSLPEDLPFETVEYLRRTLVLRDQLRVWTMTPRINMGRNEPELTPATAVGRIVGEYQSALDRSRLHFRSEIAVALHEAATALREGRPEGAAVALERARGLAKSAGEDAWSRSLAEGLLLCLEEVKRRFGI